MNDSSDTSGSKPLTIAELDAALLALAARIPSLQLLAAERCLVEGNFTWSISALVPRSEFREHGKRGPGGNKLQGMDEDLDEAIADLESSYRFYTTGSR